MEKLRVVILCASAMSSGFIVDEMKKVAPENGIDIEVECFASLRYRSYDYSKVDVILLAPQVKGQQSDIQKYLNEKGFDKLPIMLIPMRDYGLVRGKPILDLALKIVAEAQQ
ncbi:MAG: hypothetical protein WBI17_02335 [Clostridiaceae bacterium]